MLAIDAVRRWPTARVVGIDGSRGMLEVAARRATDRLSPADRVRLELEAALAERLPHEAASFDLLVSSFVYQLVPNRYRALLEARRVLRPGGMLAYVTWQDDEARCLPQDAFDEAVLDTRIEEDEVAEEVRSGDLPSAAAAAAQLRRAGFRAVTATTEWLDYRWTRDSYLDFVEQYDEWDLFSSIDEATRARLRRHARARFARLRPTDFRWRTPVIVADRPPPSGRLSRV